MRVAFAGSSGTGKTTLARFVSETYGLPINPVGSRSVSQAMGFSSPYDVDRASAHVYEFAVREGRSPNEAAEVAIGAYEAGEHPMPTMRPVFQVRLQQAKIAWEIDHASGFVTDRTSMDDMAYALLHCPSAVDRAFIERAQTHLGQYTRVIFLPLASFNELEGDPARVNDLDYQVRYETILYGLLMGAWHKRHEPNASIPSDLGERKQMVVNQLWHDRLRAL